MSAYANKNDPYRILSGPERATGVPVPSCVQAGNLSPLSPRKGVLDDRVRRSVTSCQHHHPRTQVDRAVVGPVLFEKHCLHHLTTVHVHYLNSVGRIIPSKEKELVAQDSAGVVEPAISQTEGLLPGAGVCELVAGVALASHQPVADVVEAVTSDDPGGKGGQ